MPITSAPKNNKSCPWCESEDIVFGGSRDEEFCRKCGMVLNGQSCSSSEFMPGSSNNLPYEAEVPPWRANFLRELAVAFARIDSSSILVDGLVFLRSFRTIIERLKIHQVKGLAENLETMTRDLFFPFSDLPPVLLEELEQEPDFLTIWEAFDFMEEFIKALYFLVLEELRLRGS